MSNGETNRIEGARAVDSAVPAPVDGWHLARREDARQLAELEFSLEHAMQAFYRWKSACMSAVAGDRLSGDDTAILNIVRMNDEPKGLSDIAGLLNRTDTANIQYAIRKLVKAGFLEREGDARKTARYRVTATGHAATEAYAELRERVLLPLLERLSLGDRDMVATGHVLDVMSTLYSQSAQAARAEGVFNAALVGRAVGSSHER